MTEPVKIESDAHLARLLGVDRALVLRHKRRGMPVDSLEAALAWREQNLNPAQRKDVNEARRSTGAPPSPGAPDGSGNPAATPQHKAPHQGGGDGGAFMSERTRRERAAADMAEIRARREAGELVEREPAERAAFEAFRTLRDATANALRSAAPSLLGLTTTREIQNVLEDAQRLAFADFETTMKRRMQELATA